jgi:regulator of sirC expression with transglutaminase-like and TPR domain
LERYVVDPAAHPFDAYVLRPVATWRIAEAALLFAHDRYPFLSPAHYLHRIDEFTGRVDRLGAATPLERIAALRTVLVAEEELVGDAITYDDPRNSYLNEVLDRRCGLPISLSVIWLDVARALGWRFAGVGLPGHFLIGCKAEDRCVLLDPFQGGRLVELGECERLVQNVLGPQAVLAPEHVAPIDGPAILTRMLNNLRAAYATRHDWSAYEQVLMRLMALHPADTDLVEDLNCLRGRLGRRN